MLAADKDRPKKQRHTSKRIFERLRDEHGFTGKITIVKDYVAGWRQRTQEMFVPLVHPPGHAQADFGEAIGVIGGVERKIHFFAMDLPHSDAIFVVGYPAETTEAFCDGHVRAFAFFDGVPQSILYDNLWTPPAQGELLVSAAWNARIYPACCGTVRAPGLDGSPLLLAS
jgi:transposase